MGNAQEDLVSAPQSIDLSLSIVSHNCKEYLGPLLESIRAQNGALSIETLLVDNASSDGSVEMVRSQFPEVDVIANPVGLFFIRATNQNLRRMKGRFVMLLNEDALMTPNSLEPMVQYMETHPDIGALGPRLIGFDGNTQKTSCRQPTFVYAVFQYLFLHTLFPNNPIRRHHIYAGWNHDSIRDVGAVSGMGMLIRREVIDKIGFLDETTLMYNEEIDYCRRIVEAGWKVVYHPDMTIKHYGAAATSKNPPWQIYYMMNDSFLHYFKKYDGFLAYAVLKGLYGISTILLRIKRLFIPGRGTLKS